MAFFKNLYQKLLGEEADEENEITAPAVATLQDAKKEAEAQMEDKNTVRPAPERTGLELKITKLVAFDEGVTAVADHVIAGRSVVINLEAAPRDVMRRIIDFFTGVAYTVNGHLKNISGNIYIITPENVDVSNEAALLGGGDPHKPVGGV